MLHFFLLRADTIFLEHLAVSDDGVQRRIQSSLSIWLYPMMAFSGVRSSWLIVATKTPLARLAASEASLARTSWACARFSSRTFFFKPATQRVPRRIVSMEIGRA